MLLLTGGRHGGLANESRPCAGPGSPEAENEYLSDGITDELIDALAKVEGLRVAARTSVVAAPSPPIPWPERLLSVAVDGVEGVTLHSPISANGSRTTTPLPRRTAMS